MTTTEPALEVACGAERSRKVGFAMYYAAKVRIDRLLKINSALEERLALMCVLVSENEALQLLDADGELVARTKVMLATLKLRPRGLAALNKVLRDRPERNMP